MTKNKIRKVFSLYQKNLENLGFSKYEFPHEKESPSRSDSLKHVLFMIEKAERFLEENRTDKAFRWLGFMQGCLWNAGLYTMEELKNHNRPDRK